MSLFLSKLKTLFGSSTLTKQPAMQKPSKPSETSKPTKPAAKPAQVDMPWVAEMRKALGLHEVKDKAALEKWLKSDGDLTAHPDKTPWCGEGVATAFKLGVPGIRIPENHWGSSNWRTWGTAVKPQVGCILIFWRGNPKAWQGHIGFYEGEDAANYYVLGANQSDSISITKIAKNRLREDGSRWPPLGPLPTNKKRLMDGKGMPLSTNEA